MDKCMICLESIDSNKLTIKCLNTCETIVHKQCFKNWNKCLICRVQLNNHDVKTNTSLSQVKQLLNQKDTIDLVNSYFYNHHDLKIIMNRHSATKLCIVRYPSLGKYKIEIFMIDQVKDSSFRNILISERVIHIFVDNHVDQYDNVSISKASVDLVGEYDHQIKW